jgi:uncharacterized protein YdeI (YjbR/CyaY-like superfamily)
MLKSAAGECARPAWHRRRHALAARPAAADSSKDTNKMPPKEPPANSIQPRTRAEWRAWLAQNYARREGIWLVSYRTLTGKPRLAYEEAVEEALCFGWIDSKLTLLDEERSLQWMAPRRRGSAWAKSNKERVERLTAAGLMAAPGLAKVEAAQKDGSWNLLDSVEALAVPPDLAAALAARPAAQEHFSAFPASVRKGFLYWIASAKTAATREKRVRESAELAQRNIRIDQRPR